MASPLDNHSPRNMSLDKESSFFDFQWLSNVEIKHIKEFFDCQFK